jgi:hypothetical protein
MKNSLITIVVITIICGCSKQSPSPTQPISAKGYQAVFDSITISDSQILDLAYSSFKYPDGFYQEDLTGESIYYVNTLSILPLSQRSHNASELSTNSRDQAFAWSESTNVNSSQYRKLESESQTDKILSVS